MIVDDDPGITETMADILDAMGYDVMIANDGHRAMTMVQERAFDLALMDIRMPGMNGVETFKKIKYTSPATKIVIMTAYAVESLLNEAVQEGVYGIMHKPLDIDGIVRLIEKSEKGRIIHIVDDYWHSP